MINRKIPWTSQPQFPVGIDQSNPLGAKVVYASTLAGIAYDSVTGKLGVNTAAVPVATQYGAALKFNGSSALITLPTTDLVAGYPLTVSCRFYKPSTVSRVIYSFNGAGFHAIAGFFSSGHLGVSADSSGLYYLPNASIPSGWNHLTIIFYSGSYVLYLNGAAQTLTSGGNNWTQPAAGNNAIGARLGGSSLAYFSESIQDLIVFNGALSADEAAQVYVNPYQIFQPQTRRIWVPGSTSAALAGNATGQAGGTASLTTAIPITAAALSIASASSALSTAIPLNGVAVSVAGASGALTAQVRLAADALAQALSSAALSSGIILTASAIAQAAAQGTLSTAIQLIAAAAGQASASAGLTAGSGGLSANAQAAAGASAALTIQIQLSAAALAQAAASASLTAPGAGLGANAAAVATAQGSVTTQIRLSAAALAEAIAVGGLTARIDLSANAITTASAGAWLLTAVRLAADASVISAATAALTGGSLSVVRYQALTADASPVVLTAIPSPLWLTADASPVVLTATIF